VDPVLDTAISLVTPFAAYLAAEEIHGSGVIAVVVAGLLLGHSAPVIQTASSRIAERMNWRTIAFVLENAVFLLIGLQASWIVADLRDSDLPEREVALVCLAALVAVVTLRMLWVFPARFALVKAGSGPTGRDPAPWTHTFILGWAGMRGVVTLAAAFVIPEETPYREVLLMIAFTVVAGTLLLQGLTLPWLARRLRVPPPDPAEDALARAQLLQQATQAGLAVLERAAEEDPYEITDAIRRRVEQRNFAAWEQLGDPEEGQETPTRTYVRLRTAMIRAERERVLEVRDEGTVPQEVVAEVLTMLDVEESMLDAVTHPSGRVGAGRRTTSGAAACAHLAEVEEAPAPRTPGACEECRRDGSEWVHLRLCLDCGHVGCCDSSPRRHATAHFHDSGHPAIESAEPGEDWRWCYLDHVTG
jgi:CPA1 family monovalent cation:H+ antiporter